MYGSYQQSSGGGGGPSTAMANGQAASSSLLAGGYGSLLGSDAGAEGAAIEHSIRANAFDCRYFAKEGDTLKKIARKHRMTVKELKSLNPQLDSDVVYCGQAFVLDPPDRAATLPPPPSAVVDVTWNT